MGKTLALFSGLFFTTFASIAQDTEEILRKAYAKSQSIQNGYYELTRFWKPMTETDTSEYSFHCSFSKLDNDSLFSTAFHYKLFKENQYIEEIAYTGKEQIRINAKDSTAIIASIERWADEIKKYSHNLTFYEPFTSKKSYPLSKFIKFNDSRFSYSYMGKENLNGIPCHHIQVIEVPVSDNEGMIKLKRGENHFWISESDFVLVQYTEGLDLVFNNQDMHQFYKYGLSKYGINNLKSNTVYSLNSIPSQFKLKDYTPYQKPELLPKRVMAPDWELISLTDKKIRLSELKGKLVLIDFFYKSCAPCLMALPGLQSLHEKYKNKLHVIGIDPYDKRESNLKEFLAKRGVTYTVLLEGNDVANNYNVSAYPTLYLIDKTGKIIYTQEGYSEDGEKKLEEIIKKNL